jgi:ferritin-like metal-binding protein YciE
MDPNALVLQYLSEAHATETALVTNLRAHLTMTTDDAYRRILERHLEETKAQVKNVDARRAELGEEGAKGFVAGAVGLAMDAVGQILVLSKGPLDAVRTTSQQERMLKNARDECATEAIEIALYDALEAAAHAAGDTQTAKLAADHRKQEERMLDDLRQEIRRLAVATFEDKTSTKAKPAPAPAPAPARSSRSTAKTAKSSTKASSAKSPASRSTTRSSGSRSGSAASKS